MEVYSDSIKRLIEELAALPGIGRKSARRLAFHIISMPKERVDSLAGSIVDAKNKIRYCSRCFTITDKEICPICSSDKRDSTTVMVVEESKDLSAYEKTGAFKGLYHVLGGVINPIMGIGPADIKIKELILRLEHEDIKELILATSSTLEGEATAMYIASLLKGTDIKVTRIASGVPVGGDLEQIDEVTLLRALEGRISL